MASVLVLLSTLPLAPLAGQAPDPSPPWMLSAGALTYRVSELNGWGIGPAAGAQRRIHKAIRFDMNAGVLLSSSGFYDFSGISLDVGPALVHRTGSLDLGLGIGIASVVGGDSDGTGGGWIGGYVSGQGSAWFSTRLGLTLRAAYREISTGRSSPSVSLSLAFRP